MQQYRNWDNVQAAGEFKRLEAGGYVLKIKAVKEETSRNGNQMLSIAFDIAEGERAGYYSDLFAKDNKPNKKWPNNGIHRIVLPTDDGSEEDNKKMSRLKGFINAVAESNRNYDPKKYYQLAQLNGKIVGGIFRREEYENQNGERKWTTKLAWTCSAQKIREGDFEVPADKPLETDSTGFSMFPPAPQNPYQGPTDNAGFMPIDDAIEGDEDLPF